MYKKTNGGDNTIKRNCNKHYVVIFVCQFYMIHNAATDWSVARKINERVNE